MIIKRNIIKELPVILIDSSDFVTGLSGKVFGDITCKYLKEGSNTWITKTINAGNWKINTNQPDGYYRISFTAAELNTNGIFEYNVFSADSLVYPGLFEIRDNTNDDIKIDTASIKLKTDNLTDEPTDEVVAEANKDEIIAEVDENEDLVKKINMVPE